MRYLSLEWIDALAAGVSASDSLQALSTQHTFGATQVVTDGPEGSVLYHLQVGDGVASVGAGQAFPEDVRMEQTWSTAIAVATGTLNAQEAFVEGHIRITGDTQKLLEAKPIFKALDAVFAIVREHTEYR